MDISNSIEQTPCELIFDLDGTLTDPALGFVRSVNFSLESHGISPVEEVGFSENILYDGILDVLVTLQGLGFRLGVCTSKRVDFAERILTLFDIRQYFEFVNGAEVGIKKRSQLKELMDQSLIDTRSIMIGDRHVDI